MPSQGPKTTPMVSIINQNVVRYVCFYIMKSEEADLIVYSIFTKKQQNMVWNKLGETKVLLLP